MSPRAIQFGAGSIGRGFIGALLTQSGYHVTFADVNQPLIDAINEEREYHIHILLPNGAESEQTSGTDISGRNPNDKDVIDEIVRANIITTAVGPDILKFIAPVLAKGITEKWRRVKEGTREAGPEYLNIIACENRVGATSLLKDMVIEALKGEVDQKYLDSYVGFANCSVDRIVPPSAGTDSGEISPKGHPPLDIGVESFYEWIVDKRTLKGDPPFPVNIKGMELTDNLEAFEERKLFTLNTGHAMTAYLGHLKGYHTISESIHDEEIARNVRNAMKESGAALCRRHNFNPDVHASYIERIINRFRNPHLKDECVRVGRQPLRKLGRSDRFIGPAQLCKEYELPNKHLCRAIAAAMRYDNEEDPQSKELIERVAKNGAEQTAIELTGWSVDDQEIGCIMWNYKDLDKMKVTNWNDTK